MQGVIERKTAFKKNWSLLVYVKKAVEKMLLLMVEHKAPSVKRGVSEQAEAFYSREELEGIVYRYKDMIYRLAVMRMTNDSLADDIFQETFLKLVHRKRRFESEENLKAWLLRVAINCCNDYYRSSWNRKTVPFMDERRKSENESIDEDNDDTIAEETYDDPHDSDNPLKEATYEAVESLSPNLREVIHLFYYENLSVREIAETVGAQENAVKTRLSRARSILKVKLEGIYRG